MSYFWLKSSNWQSVVLIELHLKWVNNGGMQAYYGGSSLAITWQHKIVGQEIKQN